MSFGLRVKPKASRAISPAASPTDSAHFHQGADRRTGAAAPVPSTCSCPIAPPAPGRALHPALGGLHVLDHTPAPAAAVPLAPGGTPPASLAPPKSQARWRRRQRDVVRRAKTRKQKVL